MAAIVNDRDIELQAGTRTVTTNLPANVNVPGNVTGTVGGMPVADLLAAAAEGGGTSNFFTTSTSNPVGGSAGDAHFNSSTSVMWFNINGTWTAGGTINASQIIAGTLAAARIAANSITSDKISVASLSAFSANLGSVTAGNITGTANIDITGTGRFNGATSDAGVNYAGVFNSSLNTPGGVSAYAGTSGFAVRGAAGSSSSAIGISGTSTGNGDAIRATNSVGLALNVVGRMAISSNSLVSNLNAALFNSKSASSYCQTVLGNTGTCTVSGNGFNLISVVSGQQVRGNGSNGLIIETISDKRRKRKIKKEKLGLKFVNKLNPVTYEDKKRRGFKYHGVISDELEELIEGNQDALFHVHENGMKGTDYISLIGPMIKAIQELSAEVERLKNV